MNGVARRHEWLRPKDFENKEALHMRINHVLEKYGGPEFSINFSIK